MATGRQYICICCAAVKLDCADVSRDVSPAWMHTVDVGEIRRPNVPSQGTCLYLQITISYNGGASVLPGIFGVL